MKFNTETAHWNTSVESLRGLAVLLVFISHALGHWLDLSGAGRGPLSDIYFFVFQIDFGRLGVYVFFLISGFLIPFSIKATGWPAAYDFLQRRLLRILPLYLTSIPLGLTLEHWLQGGPVSLAMTLQNLLLIPNFFGNPFALNAYWTLQIELFFYLVVFLMTPRLHLGRSAVTLAGALLLTILFAEIARPDRYDLTTEPSRVLGELAKILGGLTFIWLGALIRKWVSHQLSKLEVGLLLLYCSYAFFYLPIKYWKKIDLQSMHPTLSFMVPALALTLFMMILIRNRRLPWLEHIGMVSYSMYLLHAPVLYLMKYAAVFVAGLLVIPLNTFFGLAFLVLTFIISLMVSGWSYRYIERKFWAPSAHARTKTALI